MRRRTRRLRITKWVFIGLAAIVLLLNIRTYFVRSSVRIGKYYAVVVQNGFVFTYGKARSANLWRQNYGVGSEAERVKAERQFQAEITSLESWLNVPSDYVDPHGQKVDPNRIRLAIKQRRAWHETAINNRETLPPLPSWLPRPFWQSRICTQPNCITNQELQHELGSSAPSSAIGHRVDVIGLPIWMGVAFLTLIAALLAWRDRPIPHGRCRRCGYDLTGNTSGVCPECGRALTKRA